MFDFEAAIASVQAAATKTAPTKPVKRTRMAHKPVVVAAVSISRAEKLAANDIYFRRSLRWG